MKALQFSRYGDPREVLKVVDLPEPPPPADEEATVQLLATPVNPSDLMLVAGRYGYKPDLPYIPGTEGVGRVLAVGKSERARKWVSEGDIVMITPGENWVERRNLRYDTIVKLSADLDPVQISMLKVNPGTAYALLRLVSDLKPGETVIQNAANSNVGRCISSFAQAFGFRTVNIVRRADVVDEVKSYGGDVVVVDHKLGLDPEKLGAAVREQIGDTAIRYAFDAVGGASTERLAACMVEGGTIINYGALAGRPCQIWPTYLIFKDIKVQGFWVPRLFDQFSIERLMTMYSEILDHIANHKMPLEPAARFSFDQLDDALSMAMRQQGGSKVILSP